RVGVFSDGCPGGEYHEGGGLASHYSAYPFQAAYAAGGRTGGKALYTEKSQHCPDATGTAFEEKSSGAGVPGGKNKAGGCQERKAKRRNSHWERRISEQPPFFRNLDRVSAGSS